MKRQRDMSGDAGYVDNGSRSLLLHYENRRLHGEDGPEEISVEHIAACGHIHVSDRVLQSVACVVDPEIDTFKVVQSEAEDAVNFLAVAHVAGECQGAIGVADSAPSGFGASSIA